jgi:hypothetical protein
MLRRNEMARRPNKKPKTQTKEELVTVAYAADMDQAKDYQLLLRNNDIAAVIKEERTDSETRGIPVMVPEDFLDEAHLIVESQEAYDDFYDLSLEESRDFDGDLFDDDEF